MKMDTDYNREEEWSDLMEKCDEFFYDDDDGLYIAYLMDNSLEKFIWDMDKIEEFVKELVAFKQKYGEFMQDERDCLLEYKDIFLEMQNPDNNIEEYYETISAMYDELLEEE